MSVPLAVTVAFALGSLPFSVWIGRLALRTDIRAVGDGNPGATNVLRAGGWRLFAAAAVLDFLKGAAPVGVAYLGLGWDGLALFLVALAPVAGHAFSPFLGFRGGKAVAVTFGIWSGLTVWEGPTIFGLFIGLWTAVIARPGWVVMFSLASLLGYLLLTPPSLNGLSLRPQPEILTSVALGVGALLAWKHRDDLRQTPGMRPWVRRLLRQTEGES